MYFRMLHDEASGRVAYLLADLDAGEAVVIDLRDADLAVVQALLAEHHLRLRWLLRTSEKAGPPPAGGERAASALGAPQPGLDQLAQVLSFGGEHLHVLRTPGHTACAMSYQWRDRVFCGELLQVREPASAAPADPAALWESVTSILFTLPPETLIFHGVARHGRVVSTVLAERRWHPWFAPRDRDAFIARFAPPVHA